MTVRFLRELPPSPVKGNFARALFIYYYYFILFYNIWLYGYITFIKYRLAHLTLVRFSLQLKQTVTERVMTRAYSGSPRSSRARASTMKPARVCTTSSSSRSSRASRPAAHAARAPPARALLSSTNGFLARNPTTCLQVKTARASLIQVPLELTLAHKPPFRPCGDRGRASNKVSNSRLTASFNI